MKSFKLENRTVAALLCLVMVGVVVFSSFFQGSDLAKASSSLTGIMQLKSSGKEFTILEIVPDVSQAAFAWYVGGSEPVNKQKLSVAYSGDMTGFESSYATTTGVLQNQNYLLASEENDDPSLSVLKYAGDVKLNSSGDSLEGGFENNEWFLRHVFDWTEDELMPNIKVMSVAPENVTLIHLDMADMVVFSGGYYYTNHGTDPVAYSVDTTKNLSTEVTDSLISRVTTTSTGGLPLILDRRAYVTGAGTSLNSNRIFHEILKDSPQNVASGVYGSVFYYSAVNSTSELANAISLQNGGKLGFSGSLSMGYLVTPQFHEPFSSEHSGTGGNFNEVLKSIKAENVTRSGDDVLSEEVTMARVIRYLIDNANTSSVSSTPIGNKSQVTILSIQPGSTSGVATYDTGTHSAFGLSAPITTAKVSLPTNPVVAASGDQVSWEQLESWTGVSRSNITVVEKTMNEFVNTNESLASTYDLIYIGNDISAGNYGVYSELTQFTSNYANPNDLTYFAPLGSTLTKPATSYTASSTDFSDVRYSEITSYISEGRPVVIAPYLSAGLNWRTDVVTPSASSIDSSSNMYKLLTNASGRSNVYRQDMLIAGPDGVEGTSDDDSMISSCQSAVHLATPSISMMSLLSTVSADEISVVQAVLSATGSAEYVLEYIFQVNNETLSNDSSVSYDLGVYFDLDTDGVYETSSVGYSRSLEQLQTATDGTIILGSDGQPVREQEVGFTNLSQDKYYRLTVTLPDTVTGAVPWKLEVTSDTGAVGAISEMAVFSTTTETVKVLQMAGNFSTSVDLSSSLVTTSSVSLSVARVAYIHFELQNLSDYQVVFIGFDDWSAATAEEIAHIQGVLQGYTGAVIFADSSLTSTNLSDYPFYNAMSTESAPGVNAYPNTEAVFGDDYLYRQVDNHFYTDITLNTGSSDNEKAFLANMITTSSNIVNGVIEVEPEPDPEAPATLLIYGTVAGTNVTGGTYSVSEGDLTAVDGVDTLAFKISKNINNFTVGVRAKADGATSWAWDSNAVTVASTSNPLARMNVSFDMKWGNNADLNGGTVPKSYVTGATVDCFVGTEAGSGADVYYESSSTIYFELQFLPNMSDYIQTNFAEGKGTVLEIYVMNGTEEISASTTLTVKQVENLIKDNDYYWIEYVESATGNYVYDSVTERYVLAQELGAFYVKGDLGYKGLGANELRPATHYTPHGTWDYTEITASTEYPVNYTLYVYSEYIVASASSTGTQYYYDSASGTYKTVPDLGQRYEKKTNIVGDTSVAGGTAGVSGNLFQLG